MIKNNLRRGIIQYSFKKINTNNKYINEGYDKSKPSLYIDYLDTNNLYGLAIYKKFPYDNFKWHYDKINEKNIIKYFNNNIIKYILEINLNYSKELHNLHKNYPLVPEIMNINKNMFSKIQKHIHKYYYGKKYQ